MVSLTVAYVMWLFGGILGLHHLYLNRPRHFFIWFVTWGGMVLGWISEASRIPDYVQEANQSPEYLKRLKEMKKASPDKPELNFVFLASSLMIGHQLSGLVISAVPEEYILTTWYGIYLSHVLAALGASTGVYLVANMGPHEAPFLLPLLASTCTFPASYFLSGRQPIINLVCIIAAGYVSSEHARWSKAKPYPDTLAALFKMVGFAGCCVALYGTLWTSNMYFNMKVTTLNGTRIPLRDAVSNFIQTQPIREAREAMSDILPCVRMYSLDVCQNQFLGKLAEISDPERDRWAFNVLGFTKYPTQKQINSHCRKLASKYHPDRFTKSSDEEKKEAEQMFIDIQKACGMLNRIKRKRERHNTWSVPDAFNEQATDANTDSEYDDEDEFKDEYCENDSCDRDERDEDEEDEEEDDEEDDVDEDECVGDDCGGNNWYETSCYNDDECEGEDDFEDDKKYFDEYRNE